MQSVLSIPSTVQFIPCHNIIVNLNDSCFACVDINRVIFPAVLMIQFSFLLYLLPIPRYHQKHKGKYRIPANFYIPEFSHSQTRTKFRFQLYHFQTNVHIFINQHYMLQHRRLRKDIRISIFNMDFFNPDSNSFLL